MMTVDEKTRAVVDALEDIKASDITVLNTSEFSSLFERMVIASAQSTRQTKALADNVVEKMRAQGQAVIGVEGGGSGEWVLVDLGDVVVHIMQPAVRAYYNLEELWSMQHLPDAVGRAWK
jgi:ribosome-associated protein